LAAHEISAVRSKTQHHFKIGFLLRQLVAEARGSQKFFSDCWTPTGSQKFLAEMTAGIAAPGLELSPTWSRSKISSHLRLQVFFIFYFCLKTKNL
jgi:hypothetical protein